MIFFVCIFNLKFFILFCCSQNGTKINIINIFVMYFFFLVFYREVLRGREQSSHLWRTIFYFNFKTNFNSRKRWKSRVQVECTTTSFKFLTFWLEESLFSLCLTRDNSKSIRDCEVGTKAKSPLCSKNIKVKSSRSMSISFPRKSFFSLIFLLLFSPARCDLIQPIKSHEGKGK